MATATKRLLPASQVLVTGDALSSSKIGTLNPTEFVFTDEAWAKCEDIDIAVANPTVRDSTNFAIERRIIQQPSQATILYTASFNVLIGKDRNIAPVIPLEDVLIMYQNIPERANTERKYGISYVRIALPEAFIDKIVTSMKTKLHMRIADPPISKATLIDDDGDKYYTFNVNIENGCSVGAARIERGQTTFIKLTNLVNALNKGHDIFAYVLLSVKAKYIGPPIVDWRHGEYTLSLEPKLISLSCIVDGNPMSPVPLTNTSKVGTSLPAKAAVDDEVWNYITS